MYNVGRGESGYSKRRLGLEEEERCVKGRRELVKRKKRVGSKKKKVGAEEKKSWFNGRGEIG